MNGPRALKGIKCPVCGLPGRGCLGHTPYELPDDMLGEGGPNVMPPKAVESKVMRMPKQFVREGRGIAGYTGKVQVYDPKRTARAPRVANAEGDIVSGSATPTGPEKLEAAKLTRVQLESIAEERGITPEQMEKAVTKQELVDLIEQAGP